MAYIDDSKTISESERKFHIRVTHAEMRLINEYRSRKIKRDPKRDPFGINYFLRPEWMQRLDEWLDQL